MFKNQVKTNSILKEISCPHCMVEAMVGARQVFHELLGMTLQGCVNGSRERERERQRERERERERNLV